MTVKIYPHALWGQQIFNKDDTKDEISFWFRLKNEFPSL